MYYYVGMYFLRMANIMASQYYAFCVSWISLYSQVQTQ